MRTWAWTTCTVGRATAVARRSRWSATCLSRSTSSPTFTASSNAHDHGRPRPRSCAFGVNINTAYLSQCGAQPGVDPRDPVCAPRRTDAGQDLSWGARPAHGGCASVATETQCGLAFEEGAVLFTYTECAWDSGAGTCSTGSNTCEPETVRTTGIPYCAEGVWQPAVHMGASAHGSNPPFCYCRDDQYGVNHADGQQSRCMAGEKPATPGAGSFLPVILDDGRAPPEGVYEGRGADLADVLTIRTRKVDTCVGQEEDDCMNSYVKHDHSICLYLHGSCFPHLSRTCEMRTLPTTYCVSSPNGKPRFTKVNDCRDHDFDPDCNTMHYDGAICELYDDGTCVATEACIDPDAPQDDVRRRHRGGVAQRCHVAGADDGPSDGPSDGPDAKRALQEANGTTRRRSTKTDRPARTPPTAASRRRVPVAWPCRARTTVDVTGVFAQATCDAHVADRRSARWRLCKARRRRRRRRRHRATTTMATPSGSPCLGSWSYWSSWPSSFADSART